MFTKTSGNVYKSVFSCYIELKYALVQINFFFECKIVNIFLSIRLNISFMCSNGPSHKDSYFEYPQHNMFWLRNKKKEKFKYALFISVSLFFVMFSMEH